MSTVQPIEEMESEEEEEEVVGQVSHTVNEHITLSQPDLCVIYAWEHWTSKSEDDKVNYIEIKQIVGHPLLELDGDKYDRLDLEDVIDRFRNENDSLTRSVKVPAEDLKDLWVNWIPQLQTKYRKMCREDEKLAKQGKDELAAYRAQKAAHPIPLQEGRQEHETYPSIAAVLAGSSSTSQGGRGRGESK